jgi:hypothetical protein
VLTVLKVFVTLSTQNGSLPSYKTGLMTGTSKDLRIQRNEILNKYSPCSWHLVLISATRQFFFVDAESPRPDQSRILAVPYMPCPTYPCLPPLLGRQRRDILLGLGRQVPRDWAYRARKERQDWGWAEEGMGKRKHCPYCIASAR